MRRLRDLKDIDDEHPLKDGETVRVPLYMMDALQRSVATHLTDATPERGAVCFTENGEPGRFTYVKGELVCRPLAENSTEEVEVQYEDGVSAISLQKPGYRFIVKNTTTDAAMKEVADAHEQYNREISDAWRKAAADPKAAHTPAAPLLDSGWDNIDDSADPREEAYRLYDQELSQKWRRE